MPLESKVFQKMSLSRLEESRKRTKWTFDNFEKVYLSFSAGKDSTVMLHVTMEEAKRDEVKSRLGRIEEKGNG